MSPADSGSMKIPMVDFSAWANAQDKASRRRIARELIEACQTVGFVYIVNHSLSGHAIDEAFSWSKQFFDLTKDVKMKAPHPEGWAIHRGYSWPGLEKVSQTISTGDDEETRKKLREIPDAKEVFDIGSEDNTDQPNRWIPDDDLPGFREFMTTFYWEYWKVGRELLRAVAVGLDLQDEDYLAKKHSGHDNQLRLLHYLPVPAADLENNRDECGGLEVEDVTKPGTFVAAEPVKHAIVLNVGDLLQRWSNDRLRSTNHRVSMPPLADRIEGADHPSAVIECIPSCTNEEEPAKYKPITQVDYTRMRASMMY
ncbi:hypothetical protein HFD88_001354 [Aspergillus terreus]|nr:hypothetical protein HFD88_001354 [Aspergillus terreus]